MIIVFVYVYLNINVCNGMQFYYRLLSPGKYHLGSIK